MPDTTLYITFDLTSEQVEEVKNALATHFAHVDAGTAIPYFQGVVRGVYEITQDQWVTAQIVKKMCEENPYLLAGQYQLIASNRTEGTVSCPFGVTLQ